MRRVSLALLLFSTLINAVVPQAERDALVALYNSTNGANWTDNTNWLNGDPCDNNWYKITCNIAGDSVTQIDLSGFFNGNNLVGIIPSDLGDLSNLLLLNLGHNELDGTIPVELGKLSNLIGMSLQDNKLKGTIPTTIMNMTGLLSLSLYSNELSGSIPLELLNMISLKSLFLGTNKFTGVIPSELGMMTSLTSLGLNSNQLTGTIPTSLGNLTSLTRLNLYENLLTGNIPSVFGNLINLERLNLFKNNLSGTIPLELGSLTSLRFLTLDSNRLTGSIPNELINLTKLNVSNGLNLAYNGLYTENANLDFFLDAHQNGGDWKLSQTIAPSNLTVIGASDDSISINWDQVTYLQNGGYQVSMASDAADPFTQIAQTVSKNVTAHTQGGLTAGQNYYFNIKSFTNPHTNNQNLVTSDASDYVFDVTGTTGASADLYSVINSDNPLIKAAGNYQYYLAEIGDIFNYNIIVGNNGPDDAINSGFRHNFPVGLINGTWTCVVNSGTATCPQASGSGNIDEMLNLPNASSLKYNFSAEVDSTETNSLLITATITPPDGVSDSDLISNVQFVNFTDVVFASSFE